MVKFMCSTTIAQNNLRFESSVIFNYFQTETRPTISENVTWGQRKAMSDGKIHLAYANFLGYERGEDGKPKVIPEEAKIIKLIYRLYLEGKTAGAIAQILTELEIKTPAGKTQWREGTVLGILKNEKYKGDAILQKTFTIDFLEHKTKKNEGEVPQYVVEKSHEPIVEPQEWEQVQLERKRRSKIGRAYSCNSVFSTKLVCEECQGFYGSKVWHSTVSYRKTIWQCYNKFRKKNPTRCQTPHVTEEYIKNAFLRVYNDFMVDRTRIIEDCKMLINSLVDFEEIEKLMAEQSAEMDVISNMVKQLVETNSTTAIAQDEYLRKYNALCDKYNTACEKYQELEKEKSHRLSQSTALKAFIHNLETKPLILDEFDDSCFVLFVEKNNSP